MSHALIQAATDLQSACHGAARRAGWWTQLQSGATMARNYYAEVIGKVPAGVNAKPIPELLALVHSEISEASEAAASVDPTEGSVDALGLLGLASNAIDAATVEKLLERDMLASLHASISRALEAARKGLMDDKLPHRPGLEVELADAAIRIFDMAGGLSLDLPGAIAEKLAFNAARADHKPEHRRAEGGKAF